MVDKNFRNANMSAWIKKGYVNRIRQEWYMFSDFKPESYDYFYISNKIYSPSYISLESALEYYGVIPEAVQEITAVSTQKTVTFDTEFGTYIYRKLKNELFWGYEISTFNNKGISIASLEKTLLDYFYLNSIDSTLDLEGLRLNKEVLNKNLDMDKLDIYTQRFNVNIVQNRINLLKSYLHA